MTDKHSNVVDRLSGMNYDITNQYINEHFLADQTMIQLLSLSNSIAISRLAVEMELVDILKGGILK